MILREYTSEYNTTILPVKKSDGKSYRVVQDLRAINKTVQGIHPTVANSYTLLTTLNERQEWFAVIGLKDAFFFIPLGQEVNIYLPLRGRIQKLVRNYNRVGQYCHKDSKIVPQYLEIN